MLGVALSALASRRTQGLTVLGLAVLAAAGAAAAPWYAAAAAESVAAADLAAAPVRQRLIEVNQPLAPSEARTLQPEALRARVHAELDVAALDLAAFDGVLGANGGGLITRVDGDGGTGPVWLAYREGLCDHVVMVQGRCEPAPDAMVIGARQAVAQELRVGSRVRITASSLAKDGIVVRVAGIYRPVDPTEPYWANGELIGHSTSSVRPVEASFAAYEAVAGFAPTTVTHTYDLVARPAALRGADLAAVGRDLRQGGYDLQRGPQRLRTLLPGLFERIGRDQELVRLGVAGGAGLLLILCWFALFLAVQGTAQDRRPDLGWLRLHGTAPWRTWQLGFGQTAIPLLAGGVLGGALGFAAARWYGGGITGAGVRSAALGSALTAAVAVAGALVAAVVAEWRHLRATVLDLQRRVPPRRRSWRSDVLDLAVVLVAGAAVYQLGVSEEPTGLALFARALAALAVSLVLAWAVVPLAGRLAVRALRDGRLGAALVGAYLARRPAVHRIFALVCVAVALLGTASAAWDRDERARRQRAEVQLGAARVLTVTADSHAHLLAAVRAADPGGRAAMAAVRSDGTLAVDTPRLAATALWRAEYGLPAAAVADLLRPPTGPPVEISGSGLAVTADVPAGTSLSALVRPRRTGDRLLVRLQPAVEDGGSEDGGSESGAGGGEDGGSESSEDGAGGTGGGEKTGGGATLTGAVPQCARLGGCRLVGFAVAGAAGTPAAVTLRELRQTGPDAVLVDRAAFADRGRWRPTVEPDELGPALAAGPAAGEAAGEAAGAPAGLSIRLTGTPVKTVHGSGDVFVVDAPVPLPVLAAGALAVPELAGDTRLRVGVQDVPAKAAATADLLPVLGRRGALIDLEYVDRLLITADPGAMQVWLARDADAGVLDRLRAAGLTVLREETTESLSDRLGAQGPAVGLRFQLLVALLGVVLAAGSVTIVAAVESPARAAELAALRGQGLDRRQVRRVALTDHVALVGVALLAGAVAAVVAAAVTRATGPTFVDGWNLLPPPAAGPVGLGLAAAAPLVVLGGTAVLAGVAMTRAVRARETRPGGTGVG